MTELSASGSTPALELTNLSKQFGGVKALDGVSLTVLPGEVHGLLGENGSGKSTLIKVLAGFHVPESGEMRVNGREVKLPLQPGKFRELGLSFVHQDLGLIPSLTVIENLRIADLSASTYRWRIPWARERRRAREIFARYGVSLDPGAEILSLKPVERAMLAIVRAVEEMREEEATYDRKGLLILDEPTVFLPKTDVDHLFSLVREIVSRGDSVLFVSHDLDEVREITDRVTVLRDGRNAGTVVTREAAEGEIIELHHRTPPRRARGRSTTISPRRRCTRASGASRAAPLDDLAFELHAGEVLGLTGLVGSGFEEVPYFLFGAWKPRSGRLEVGGQRPRPRPDDAGPGARARPRARPRRPATRRRRRLPADRRQRDPPGARRVRERPLPRPHRAWCAGRRELMGEFDVRPPRPRLGYGSLSGGNQQKALLAKWMQIDPSLLLLHEPTQGVDVGARQQIFGLVREAAARGMSVICASSDYEQLAAICDRVLDLRPRPDRAAARPAPR